MTARFPSALMAVLPLVCSTVATQSQAPRLAEVQRALVAMGTELRLEVRHVERRQAVAASEAARSAVARVEHRLSTWADDSELSRLNRAPAGEAAPVSKELAEDLRAIARWHEATDGAFEPGIGALVDAWGLRSGGRKPSDAEIEAARTYGFEQLEIGEGYARWARPRVRIEEGGFAKGIALDQAVRALSENGAIGVVDLGGQLAATEDHRWSCSLADPRHRRSEIAELTLLGGSIATSGNSERGIVVDGEPLGHLLDPRTGYPAPDFGSMTVWASSALDADCLSTALYVLGADAALRFASERPGVEVVVAEVDGDSLRLRATAGLRTHIQVRDDVPLEFVASTQSQQH